MEYGPCEELTAHSISSLRLNRNVLRAGSGSRAPVRETAGSGRTAPLTQTGMAMRSVIYSAKNKDFRDREDAVMVDLRRPLVHNNFVMSAIIGSLSYLLHGPCSRTTLLSQRHSLSGEDTTSIYDSLDINNVIAQEIRMHT